MKPIGQGVTETPEPVIKTLCSSSFFPIFKEIIQGLWPDTSLVPIRKPGCYTEGIYYYSLTEKPRFQ